jgi:hypothetical protein
MSGSRIIKHRKKIEGERYVDREEKKVEEQDRRDDNHDHY